MSKFESMMAIDHNHDPALPGEPFHRVRYGYGLLLGAEDFEVEQRSMLLGDRIHAASLHGSGTVAGLAVHIERDDVNRPTGIVIAPGLAIDPIGRTIHVDKSICLDVSALFAHQRWSEFREESVEVETDDGVQTLRIRRAWVTLRYSAVFERLVPGPKAAVCQPSEHGLIPSRIRDTFRADLVPTEPTPRDWPPTALPGAPGATRETLLQALTSPERYQHVKACWEEADEDAVVTLAEVWLVGDRDDRPVQIVRLDDACRRLLVPTQSLADATLIGATCPGERFAALGAENQSDENTFRTALRLTSPVHPGTVAGAVTLSILAPQPTASWAHITPTFSEQDSGRTLLIEADAADLSDGTLIRLSIGGDTEHPLIDQNGRLFGGHQDTPLPPAGEGQNLHIQFIWPPHGEEEL